jgi:hypothetical protein
MKHVDPPESRLMRTFVNWLHARLNSRNDAIEREALRRFYERGLAGHKDYEVHECFGIDGRVLGIIATIRD